MKRVDIKLPVVYSSKKVTPFGGMRLLKDFVDRVGFLDLLGDDELPQPQSNRGYAPKAIILEFWLSLCTGASRFIHADWLRYDEVLKKIFGFKCLPNQSTYSRFFHKFSWARNEAVFAAAQAKFFDYVEIDSLTVDLDSTIITRYGDQQGAKKGYNPTKPGRNSHHPLMAFVPQLKLVANAWLRPGNTADMSSYEPFMQEAFERVLRHHKVGLVRADSGFYSDGLLSVLESKSLNYIVAVKFYSTIIHQVSLMNRWHEIAPGLDYGVFDYTSASGVTRRYVVLRKDTGQRSQASGKILDLFDQTDQANYRYSCFVTNLDLPGIEDWTLYKGRADSEIRIKDLKSDFGMDNFRLSNFWTTETAFRFMMMAYNIISLFRYFGLQDHKRSTLQTIRVHCFALGAWTSTHAKKKVLKISLPVKRRAWMDGIFDQINGLSPPFQYPNA